MLELQQRHTLCVPIVCNRPGAALASTSWINIAFYSSLGVFPHMLSSDPIQVARTLIRLGRTVEALTTLEQARVRQPERIDIKLAIAELQHATSASGRAFLALDLVVIWLLLVGIGALVGWLGYNGFLALTQGWAPPGANWFALTMFGAIIFGSIAGTLVWFYLFLHAWFCYLKYLSWANRAQVEFWLPTYFNLGAVQPLYSRVRRYYFDD